MNIYEPFLTEKDFLGISFQVNFSQNFLRSQKAEIIPYETRNKDQDLQDEKTILDNFNKTAQIQTGSNIQYHRLSYISIQEQKYLLDKYEEELNGIHTTIDKNQITKLKELKAKVSSEQQEYQHFVYQHVRNNTESLNTVHDVAKQYAKDQHYNLKQTFGLSVSLQFKGNHWLEFQEVLLQTGDVPKIEIPTERFGIPLKNTDGHLSLPQYNKISLPLHKDPAALSLAQKYGANIVITSSCLTTLFENEQLDQEWNIPVVVIHPTNDSQSNKVVFLEKPLPGKSHTPQQMMRNMYKRKIKERIRSEDHNQSRNFVYSLWKMGKFTILLRCKLDAYTTDEHPHRQKYFSIAVKPEYFLYFGHERLSPYETAKWWLRCYIRPSTSLLCARVDSKSHNVIRIDEMSAADVLSSGSCINHGQRIKVIYHVICNVSEIASGCYVLSHQSNSSVCSLYQKALQSVTAKKPDLNLYSRCCSHPNLKEYGITHIPWSGIDTELFTTENIKQNQIPATFPAVDDSILYQIREKAHHLWKANISCNTQKSNKRKKKKARRQQRNAKPSNTNRSGLSQDTDATVLTNRQIKRAKRLRYRDFDAIQ